MGTISPLYHIELQDKDGSPTPPGKIGEVVHRPAGRGETAGGILRLSG